MKKTALVLALLAAPSAFAANVAVFDNGSYVDTAGSPNGESDNVQASLVSLGHTVNTFTGITASDFTAAFSANDLVLIPDLEVGDLNAALAPATRTAILNAVSGGKTLIVHAHVGSRDEAFLNAVFGTSFTGGGSFTTGSSTLNTVVATGTAFAGGPPTLPNSDGTYPFAAASVPAGARRFYVQPNGNPTVLSFSVGSGQVIFIAYDWFGTPTADWSNLLGRAVGLTPVSPTGVTISDATPAAVLYAQEIVASAASPVTLTNTLGSLNLTSALGFSFGPTEVRTARIECPSTVRFLAGSTVVTSDAAAAALGPINGLGSSVITFSITANNSNLTAANTITVTGDRSITAATDVSCSYSLYDTSSQAEAGGALGRIVSRSGAYLTFGPSWEFLADPSFTSTANVGAVPAYTAFVPAGDTTATRAGLAELTYGVVTPTPLRVDGNAITLADLMATGASGTTLRVTGNFTAAANADGSYTGAALNRVFIATGGTCTTLAAAASALTATTATFNVGATVRTDANLCLQANGTTAIPASTYTAQVIPVAASAAYVVSTRAEVPSGRIQRNGVELQATLAQLPPGWLSRVALVNSGGLATTYSWSFTPSVGGSASEGTTVTTGATSGTGALPANATVVVSLRDLLGGFGTTPARGTFTVTAEAPDGSVQGLYQVVNPANGSISNTVMVRPGTN